MLTQAVSLIGNEQMEAVQAGTSVRVTAQQIANLGVNTTLPTSSFVVKPAATSIVNQGATSPDPDLQVPLLNGTYIIEVGLNVSSNGGGWQGFFAFNGGTLPNAPITGIVGVNAYSSLLDFQPGNVSGGWNLTNAQFNTNGNPFMFTATFCLVVGLPGTLAYNWGQNAAAAGATTTYQGSYIRYQKIA